MDPSRPAAAGNPFRADAGRQLEALVRALGLTAAVVDGRGTVLFATDAWRDRWGGRDLLEILAVEGGDDATEIGRSSLEELASGGSDLQEAEYEVSGSAPTDPAPASDLAEPAASGPAHDERATRSEPGHWHRLRLVRIESPTSADAGPAAFAAEILDVTRQKAVQAALRGRERRLKLTNVLLRELSERDPLTSLWNRRGLERVLQREQRQHKRTGEPLSALLIDCDDFKRVNDRFGHTAGDRMLRRLGRVLQVHLRPRDAAARIGGDEFVVLLPATDLDGGHSMAERLRKRIAETLARDEEFVSAGATVSLGVGEVPAEAVGLEQVLVTTQSALKAAKAAGKNRVVGVDGSAPGRPPSGPPREEGAS